jgi:hypothetical protein
MKNILKSQIEIGLKRLSIRTAIEILIIILISLYIGYFINNSDPLFLNYPTFNYFFILIIIFSLFYGLGAGLISLFIYIVFAYFFYKTFPQDFFLYGLLLTFVAGEFHYYWVRKIENIQTKVQFLNEKLREIGMATLTTKLSHDQIEKSYLSKPYTVRGVVAQILKEKDINKFLKFLSNQFFIESFGLFLYSYKKDKIINKYLFNFENINEDKILKNPMVERMFEIREIVYMKNLLEDEVEIEYIAAIPILDLKDNIKAFILIKDMPFIHYNEENLLSVQIVTDYFLWQYEKFKLIEKSFKPLIENLSKDFQFELFKLYKLNKNIGVESSIIIFKIEKKHSEIFENFLRLGLRALDFFEKIKAKDFDIFIVVLPLISKEGGFGFVNRVYNIFDFLDEAQKYNVFNIKNLKNIKDLILNLTKEENSGT